MLISDGVLCSHSSSASWQYNAVAAEFEPIVTPSIAPPLMSALSILTDPVPFGVSVMSPFVTRPVIVDAVFEMFVTPKSVDAVLKIAVSLFAVLMCTSSASELGSTKPS